MDNTMIITKDGKEVKCRIIFTYYSEEFKKNYVIFQPEDENVISAMSYVEDGDKSGVLSAIETEDEWNMLEEVVNDYYDEKGNECCEGSCEGCNGCSGCGDSEI
ncbi:MAG: DUF1292 domain-containing protein [Acholeplasmatales bacterium]|nr:DUF1292 domain-containing protein [Acholeplasmatales bacterium]